MDWAILILGSILVGIGIVGCILPVIPGPPFAYAAIILSYFLSRPRPYSLTFIILMGVVTVVVTLLDYIVPSVVSRKYGASKYGSWGALIGMIAGMVLFPPFGIFIGALLGAVLFELIFRPDIKRSLKAGLGVLVGIVLGIFIKLTATSIMGYYFIKSALNGIR